MFMLRHVNNISYFDLAKKGKMCLLPQTPNTPHNNTVRLMHFFKILMILPKFLSCSICFFYKQNKLCSVNEKLFLIRHFKMTHFRALNVILWNCYIFAYGCNTFRISYRPMPTCDMWATQALQGLFSMCMWLCKSWNQLNFYFLLLSSVPQLTQNIHWLSPSYELRNRLINKHTLANSWSCVNSINLFFYGVK